jgi:hypothetical protein
VYRGATVHFGTHSYELHLWSNVNFDVVGVLERNPNRLEALPFRKASLNCRAKIHPFDWLDLERGLGLQLSHFHTHRARRSFAQTLERTVTISPEQSATEMG